MIQRCFPLVFIPTLSFPGVQRVPELHAAWARTQMRHETELKPDVSPPLVLNILNIYIRDCCQGGGWRLRESVLWRFGGIFSDNSGLSLPSSVLPMDDQMIDLQETIFKTHRATFTNPSGCLSPHNCQSCLSDR